MRIWKHLEPDAQLFHGSVVTIGNFDGLHLGHQTLLHQAKAVGQPRVVITFDPHPLQILRPEVHLQRLFPRADLIEQLPKFGVDLVVILPFDQALAKLSALDFLTKFVTDPFRPRHFVAGYDFALGQAREGNLDILRKWTREHAIELHVLPPLHLHEQIVSSRRIRDLILRGDVTEASQLLNRPFYLRGEVVAGAGRGAGIGIPTLNQKVLNETFPAGGVYASRTSHSGTAFFSVTNIGTNPTFEDGPLMKVETHVLDQNVDWRGKIIDVELLERLRDERKFSSVQELQTQIHADVERAKSVAVSYSLRKSR